MKTRSCFCIASVMTRTHLNYLFLLLESFNGSIRPGVLDEVSLGKLGRNLYRQPTLQRGWVNAVIQKPRDYFVIENLSPLVFNENEPIGVGAYKKEGRRPTALVALPAWI